MQNPQSNSIPEHLLLVRKPLPSQIHFDGSTNESRILGCCADDEPICTRWYEVTARIWTNNEVETYKRLGIPEYRGVQVVGGLRPEMETSG